MKKLLCLIICLLSFSVMKADEQQKFSPEKFQADMEQFITQEAKLTSDEAAKFFPLLREMHQKQRAIYGRIGKLYTGIGTDDKACARAIRESDRLNVELRQVEQQYHEKMMRVIPASKLSAAIAAENRFHRQMMRGWGGRHGVPGGPANANGRPKDKRR